MRIYEINTWLWLADLSTRYGRAVTLGSVPAAEWDEIVAFRFDAVWLMGVWRRSAQGRAIAQQDPAVQAGCRMVLPGFTPDDVVCSPYCVAGYVVDSRLGGPEALARARAELARRNLKLLLDFVPNHTAPDHPWTAEHPEYYVRGDLDDLRREPGRFFSADGDTVFARGAVSRRAHDVWADTVQLNPFEPGFRDAAIRELLEIAGQCDGVRCDMAMLLLSTTFRENWGVGDPSATEFWASVIGRIRASYPGFIWIAEAYSDSEWSLQQLGFDYCYDKDKLYDRLSGGSAESVRQHLQRSDPAYLGRLIHFLENHDEPPVGERFQPPGRHQLAAIANATLPGASLWYDRQLDGRWGKLPVQLGRQITVRQFYQRLLVITDRPAIRQGEWCWCPSASNGTLLAWGWRKDDDRVLVVINLGPEEAWDRITIPWQCLGGKRWLIRDLLTGESYGPREGDSIGTAGLAVGRPAWGGHLLEFLPIGQ